MAKTKARPKPKTGRKVADPYDFPFGANVKRPRRRKPVGGGS
jgi:hypothetical protein